MDKENEWYEFLQDHEIATPAEIDLVCDIAGYSVNTLSNILYVREGYVTMEQYLGIDEDEEDEDDDA